MSTQSNRLGATVALGTAFLATLLLAAVPASAGDQSGGEVGILTCKTVPDSRLNLLVHSTADIECEFRESDGTVEHYVGETGIGFGIDLHLVQDETVIFTVLAGHFEPGTHQLAGDYAGAKAGVTAGVGGGAALLVGGSNDSIGLKPAVSHSTGVGLAAGLGYLSLEPKPVDATQDAAQ